jgi:hypothetical protein
MPSDMRKTSTPIMVVVLEMRRGRIHRERDDGWIIV